MLFIYRFDCTSVVCVTFLILVLLNAKLKNFQLYHGRNKLHFEQMMFALY